MPVQKMQQNLYIDKLKGFGSRANIPLAPITLIFGWNSAGKSTAIQSLMLLKQTFEAADLVRPNLVVNGPYIQMGSFRNIVHKHDADLTMELGIDAVIDRGTPKKRQKHPHGALRIQIDGKGSGASLAGGVWDLFFGDDSVSLEFQVHPGSSIDIDGAREGLRVSFKDHAATRNEVARFLRYLREPDPADSSWSSLARDISRFGRTSNDDRRFSDLTDNEIDLGVKEMRLNNLVVGLRFDRSSMGAGFVPHFMSMSKDDSDKSLSRVTSHALSMALQRVESAVRRFLGDAVYLGPFRQPPERLVLLTGEQFGDVGSAGENTIALLARSSPLRGQVDSWFERLGIPYKLAIDELDTARETLGDALVAGLREVRTGTSVGIRDVGFGVSQVLPVVVQAVVGKSGLLAIEQPELHVHPRLQAQLGDLFAARAKQGGRFLLETHSEHLILRLLSLVRSGRLDPEMLSVIYVDRDDDYCSVVERLRVDGDGEFIDRWPHGFFTERRRELF